MQSQTYLDFDVDLAPSGGTAYPLAVLDSPAGAVRSVFTPPWPPSDPSHWKGLIEVSLQSGGLRATSALMLQRWVPLRSWRRFGRPAAPTDETEHLAAEIGRRLTDALFNEQVLPLFLESRQRAVVARCGLRIKLRLRAPELAMLPWELLIDPASPPDPPVF